MRANLYVTDLVFDATSRRLFCCTHRPPEGTVHLDLEIPNGFLAAPFVVNVYGESRLVSRAQIATYTTLSLEFTQGPHVIEVCESQQEHVFTVDETTFHVSTRLN